MATSQLELLHAAPSYYSMVARLALAEAGVPYRSHLIDIHLAKQQLSDAYRQLNPHMTVPTLRGEGLLLTDSRAILQWAAAQAGEAWMDGEPALRAPIGAVVEGHYAISIEDLTFGKLLLTQPLLARVVPKVLARLAEGLDQRAATAADGGASLRAKAAQNRQRLAYFTEGSAPEKLAQRQQEVRTFLQGLPPVSPGEGLFGPRFSSADVVVAVLLARLAWIGEGNLVSRTDLQTWWAQVQRRPAFKQAEVWTRFRRRRFVQAILQARLDPIGA
jgi:tetrachloro-p-hydroquinone reductive dehalogenase